MSCGNPWNQNQVLHPSPFNPPPAVLNRKDMSVSFLQFPPPRKEFNMIQDVYPQNNQMIKYECSTMQNSLSVIRQFPGREFGMIQGQYPLVVSALNITQNSNLLHRQLSSNTSSVFKASYSPTDLTLVNKSNGNTSLQYNQLSSEGTHPPTDRMFGNASNGATYLQLQLSSEGSHPPTHGTFASTSNGTTYLKRQLSSEGAHPPSDRIFGNESNGTTYLQRQLSSEGAHPPTDRMFGNESNGIAYLQNQLSSEGTNRIWDFHPVTYQLPASESNISQQFCSLNQQLPSTGMNMNQNSNMFNQQLFIGSSKAKNLPNNVLSQNEFNGNPVKYSPDDQQSVRKSILSQGSRMIFTRYSKDALDSIQNQNIPSHQNVGKQLTKFPDMGSNGNHELQVSDTSLYQNSFPQYFEEVCICVIGPPLCGKADLIRTFTGDKKIDISTDRPLSRVKEHVSVGFNTTLKIDIWYGKDLTSTVDGIRSLCQSSKSAIVLVYRVAEKSTLSDALEWIKVLQKDIDFNVPIILVGNTGYAHFSRTSSELTEAKPNLVQFRDRVKDKYDLSAFYECSTYSVKDVEEIFIVAALKAFNRTIKKSVQGW